MSSLRAFSSIRLALQDRRVAGAVVSALRPEIDSLESDRADLSLRQEGRIIVLEIDADSLNSLRVFSNSYLRWILSSVETIEIFSEEN